MAAMTGRTDTLVQGVLDRLTTAGLSRGDLLGVAVNAQVGVGLATNTTVISVAARDIDSIALMRAIEAVCRPRWVWWSIETPLLLTAAGLRAATCWDVSVVHRLLHGGWKCDIPSVWCSAHGLSPGSIPVSGQLDLLGGDSTEQDSTHSEPVRGDGYLRAEWVDGAWADSPAHLAQWSAAAIKVCALQHDQLEALVVGGSAISTARSESAAEMLCAELQLDGLPVDVARAESLIGSLVGPRPRSEREAVQFRHERDAAVLVHAPESGDLDLRNPAHVKTLLRRIGIELPDTRAWRLKELRDAHPVIEALLHWRKAERVATTYGYSWLDEHVTDGRLRGGWTGTDGAAGRMTAQAGLHNMPVDMRELVAAQPGYVFVRADLGQIEPRVLAAVSGDPALATATAADDLYAPIAKRLAVERAVAKVAVLAAMYGQTSGVAGQALHGLEGAYPVAMQYLRSADEQGQAGRDLRTYGGRLVRMWPDPDHLDDRALRAVAAGRGRYARNAMVQGAAAELFKVWAAIVRGRTGALDAQIVLCLHDEVLVHAPRDAGEAVKAVLADCLQQAAYVWAPSRAVRFVLDAAVIDRWSEAK